MYLISGITDAPKQEQTLILPNDQQATLYLEFKPQQTGWFMTLTYGAFVVRNMRVVNSPNILRQFKNLIPFGFGCFLDDKQEPLFVGDFQSERAKLYILDEAEVGEFEDYLSGEE